MESAGAKRLDSSPAAYLRGEEESAARWRWWCVGARTGDAQAMVPVWGLRKLCIDVLLSFTASNLTSSIFFNVPTDSSGI